MATINGNGKKKKLIDFNESESDECEIKLDSKKAKSSELTINKNYAQRYDNWRGKEELQKLKDKYGDVDNLNEDDDESSEESEDEDAKELTEDVEKDFFKALSLLKSKDAKIYNKDECKFFEEKVSPNVKVDSKANGEKKSKPFHLKDLEREMILKKMKSNEDEDIDDEEIEFKENANERSKINKKGYYEEQDEIKKSLIEAINSTSESENDEGFLLKKNKSTEEKAKEEADYIEWLKGKKKKVKDVDLEKNMKTLHDYWNDPKLSDGEKFLRDYILNKRYLSKEDDESEDDDEDGDEVNEAKNELSQAKSSKSEPQGIDYVEFSEEEDIIEKQEEFERKYNFRYEEPDPEFIKSYPRTVADSMRRKDTKRKEKRDEYKKRKEAEKQRKKEEIKRLKNLKRKEIQDKIEKLKRITGNFDLKLNVEDLDKDFDPDEYENKMQSLFNDEYYQNADPKDEVNDEDDEKPVFTDDDEEDLKYMNYDEWPINAKKETVLDDKKANKKKKKKKKNDEEDDFQDDDFEMDCENLEPVNNLSKKPTKLNEALLKAKPLFNPDDKSFEEYFDEYYKLDCEDVIGGDLPCRFKYREVVPNDFGLDIEEIFGCKDSELNQWASLKKTMEYRPIKDEIFDSKVYKNRKTQMELKKKILASFYNKDEQEDETDDDNEKEKPIKEAETKEIKSKKQDKISSGQTPKKEKDSKATLDSTLIKEKPQKSSTQSENSKEADSDKQKKKKHKKKNKNVIDSLTDARLEAYGIDPKKFHKKVKYGDQFKKKAGQNV